MQMRHREIGVAPAGCRDRLAAGDAIVLSNEDGCEPRTRARDAPAVIDREEEASADLAGERHDAAFGCEHDGADLHSDVDAAVAAAVGRIGRVVAAHDGTGHGPAPRDRGIGTRRDDDQHDDGKQRTKQRASHRRNGSGLPTAGS